MRRDSSISTKICIDSFKNISIISYIFYSYLIFLIARCFAYPQDTFLHIIVAIFSVLIFIIFILDPPFLKSFINKCEVCLSISEYGSKVVFILIFIVLLLGLVYPLFKIQKFDEDSIFTASVIIFNDGIHNFLKNYNSIPWIIERHPPLVPLINSFVFQIFGVYLYVTRITGLIFSVLTLFFLYLIGTQLYNRAIGFFSAAFLLLSQLYFRISCITSMDIPLVFFFVSSLYLFLNYLKTHRLIYAFSCAFLIALGLYTKYPMFLIYPVLLIYMLLTNNLLCEIKKCGIWIILLVPLIIFTPWLIFLVRSGVIVKQYHFISHCIEVFCRYKLVFVFILRFFFSNLPSGIGVQNIPFFLIGLFKVIRERSDSNKFILCWILSSFIIFPVIYTVRYLLPIFPAIAIVMSCGLMTISKNKLKPVFLSSLYSFITLIMHLFATHEPAHIWQQ